MTVLSCITFKSIQHMQQLQLIGKQAGHVCRSKMYFCCWLNTRMYSPICLPYLPLNELLKPRVFEPTLLQGSRLAFFVEFRTREINLNSLDYFAYDQIIKTSFDVSVEFFFCGKFHLGSFGRLAKNYHQLRTKQVLCTNWLPWSGGYRPLAEKVHSHPH